MSAAEGSVQKAPPHVCRYPVWLLRARNPSLDRPGRVCCLFCGESDFPIVHFADIQDTARTHV
jgi:hypothetical protein